MPDKPPIAFAPDRDPWDQQPGETTRQYSRFRTFLELGRVRSLKQAAEMRAALGDTAASLRQLYNLSRIYRWAERAGAFDADQDRLHSEQLWAARRDMLDRHIKVARALTGKALQRLRALPADGIKPADVVAMLRLAAELEHRAIGEPDTRVAVTGADGGPLIVDDLSRYTPDERRQRMQQIAEEVARRAAALPGAPGPDGAPAGELDAED